MRVGCVCALASAIRLLAAANANLDGRRRVRVVWRERCVDQQIAAATAFAVLVGASVRLGGWERGVKLHRSRR